MANLFVKPSILLTESNVLSASSETGLVLEQPVPGSNTGRVNLDASGTPTAAVALSLRLATGGNPTGYATEGGAVGSGAQLLWKNQSDASSTWRGYTDTRFLTRHVPWTVEDYRSVGGFIELSTGAILLACVDTTTIAIVSLSTAYSPTTLTTITDSYGTPARPCRICDMARLDNGRIVALYLTSTTVAGKYAYKTVYSDDEGATWATLGEVCALTTNLYEHVNLVSLGDTLIAVVSDNGTNGGEVWISSDGGASFTMTDNNNGWKSVRACKAVGAGVVIASVSQSSTLIQVHTYRCSATGILSDVVLADIGDDDSSAVGIVRRDDGCIWLFAVRTSTTDHDLYASVSLDDGATWVQVPSDSRVSGFEASVSSTYGWVSLDMGVWQGRVVAVGIDNHTAAIHWVEFGGWDQVADNTLYQAYIRSYFPIETPNNVGWTATVSGAGATVTAVTYLTITSALAGNTLYTAPSAWWSATTDYDYRLRFGVRIRTGGSTTNDTAILRFSQSDGVNYQGIKFNFASTGYKVYDQAGNTLATVTTSLTAWQEFLVVYRYDHTANNGAVRIWRRAMFGPTSGAWTEDLALTTFAESVGTTQTFSFGGTSLLTPADWDIAYLGIARGSGGLQVQSNPNTLPGRPLPDGTPFWVQTEVALRGIGTGGIAGDTWTLDTGYQYAAGAIWRNQRPSCQWRSTADNTSTNVVFDAGAGNVFRGQIAALFGINFRTATLQWHTSDSWGAPSATLAVDATIVSGAINATKGKGYVGFTITSGFTMVAHMFKSSPGQRFFVEVAGTSYEISDNSDTVLYVEGIDFSASTGTLYVYSDRVAVDYGSMIGYRFMRLLIGAQQTVDDDYRVGYLLWNEKHSISTLYDRGFVDEWQDNLSITETEAGQSYTSIRGPRRRRLLVRWNNLNRMLTSYEESNLHFFATLRGEAFAHWRNTSDPSAVTLYRLESPTVARENTLGELSTAVSSRGQLAFIEVL